jgi:polyisoprenoid-binding protein YceI
MGQKTGQSGFLAVGAASSCVSRATTSLLRGERAAYFRRMSNQNLGPHNANLQVKTYRQGIAQKVGHDLVLDVTSWEASVNLNGDASAMTLDCDSSSLEVREGLHGAKPLSDKDRAEIRKNIDDKILKGQPIRFRSSSVKRVEGGVAVQGELSIGDQSRPVEFDLDIEGDRLKGAVPLVQSEFGIKPFKALMGALKVRDDIEIVIDAPVA